MGSLAAIAVAVPLVAAAALAATDFVARRVVSDVVAVGTGAAVTSLCAILVAHTLGGHPIVYWLGGWKPAHGVAIGISLSVDTLGAGMATLVGVIVTASLVFSARYFDAVGNLFHALVLVFMAAMVGFALSGDLFNMFVFFELMSVAAYALTAYKIEEKGPLEGAINFAITNSVGAFMVLIGTGLVYARTGALNLAQIGTALAHQQMDMLLVTALLLILLGFLVKAAAFPVHFWLADAHAVAPIPVCVLFSGVMVELGLYAVARVYWTVFSGPVAAHAGDFRNIVLWVGVATALVGAVMCVSQRHLKRLLAFSTVSHMGIFLAGFSLLTVSGLAGSATYLVAHGLGKASLFMCVGVLLHRYAVVEEHALRGKGRAPGLAVVGVTMAAGGLLVAAAPMLGSFFGKSLIDGSALQLGYGWLPAVLAAASVLTAGAILRATCRIFLGWGPARPPDDAESREALEDEEFETLKPHDRSPPLMVVPAVVLMVAALVVGLVPGLVHEIEHGAAHFRDAGAYAAAVLHGGAAFADTHPSKLHGFDFLYATASTLAALTLVGLSLFGERVLRALPRPIVSGATTAFAGLRAMHSGHVGDYITWLTVGLATLGGLFTLALR